MNPEKTSNSATQSVDKRLSADLGIDVVLVEQQIRFRLDHARLQRGEPSELGYVLIDRRYHPDVAVVFTTIEEANAAYQEHPLIDCLCEEDALDCYVPDSITIGDLASREIILP